MEPATCDGLLRCLAQQQPFQPSQVDHSETLELRGGMRVYLAARGFRRMFHPVAASRLLTGMQIGRKR